MWDGIIRKKLPKNKADSPWYFAGSEKADDRGSRSRRKNPSPAIAQKQAPGEGKERKHRYKESAALNRVQ